MGCCKLNIRIWVVFWALSWIQRKRSWHSFFSKEQTSSFCVFVCTALFDLFPIRQHQSLGTAGPATCRTTNSLCQAPRQMVLTLSWRVWTLSIKQHHLFKVLDEEPWKDSICPSIFYTLKGVPTQVSSEQKCPGKTWFITGLTNRHTNTLQFLLHLTCMFRLWQETGTNPH